MTEREHCEKVAWPFVSAHVERRTTEAAEALIDLLGRERASVQADQEERDQAELDRDLARLGCVHDPDWGNPSLRLYQVAPREHVRRLNRGEDALLILNDDGWIWWALLRCDGYPSDDPAAIRFEVVMRGCGPGGKDSLREPRHTHFGPTAHQAGYVFYVQPKLIDWAFDQLREYFDFDGDQP